jgi:hypothetical protein
MAFIAAKWQHCAEGRTTHIVQNYGEVSTGGLACSWLTAILNIVGTQPFRPQSAVG